MKIAPLWQQVRADAVVEPRIVHTGQHFDPIMSEVFFEDFELPVPAIHLGSGGTTHAEQTARIILAYGDLLARDPSDWIIVVGDVDSTLAAALTAKKLQLPVAHLEAGLRSGDRTMPEEINRLMTDAIADLLWTPSEDADDNLRREGIPDSRIARVGNIMIDAYQLLRSKIEAAALPSSVAPVKSFGLVTLHRPANVDHPDRLRCVLDTLVDIGKRIPLVFPIHPRTRRNLEAAGLHGKLRRAAGLICIEPLGYVQFMALTRRAQFVITDSGGIQEETTYLGIPCMTLRATTERPITVIMGTNRLVTLEKLSEAVTQVLDGDWPQGSIPPLWDGRTATRVAASLYEHLKVAA
jgi:UDP-N-acetylglucosamine 2-epimerase (non-hydrolysing)